MVVDVLSGMVLPSVETEHETQQYGKFVVRPLEQGWGVTLGNALRRTLLSSLPGAAVTRVHIEGVLHEFSVIPGVREDVMNILMQIKQLRIKLDPALRETVRLYLDVRGAGVVTAADISVPSGVDILNPELYLFTIDDEDTSVSMSMVVERGRGFSLAEERVDELGPEEIAVDALFSPVRKVNFEVFPERVGQYTNYDRLVLDVWTDGSMTPREALETASRILIEHFARMGGVVPLPEAVAGEEVTAPEEEADEAKEKIPQRLYQIPIEELELSVRVFNSLKRAGITSVGQILELMQRGRNALLGIRNFGEKSLNELVDQLEKRGYLPDFIKERLEA